MIDLKNILGKNEDWLIEAKSAKGGFPDSFWETYSAFANTDGGTILLGVEERDNHTLYVQDGLADAEKMKETFWKLVNNRQKVSHNIVTNSMVYVAKLDGKDILVVEVPRAERTVRPVYKGLDPRNGSYRRWGEGDHLCTIEEISAMLRDASTSPLDAQPIEEMDMSVFCEESVNGYRNVYKSTNPHHLWNKLDNEMFLRRIKAVAMGKDGRYHPTEAGLLMFGYEYEITSRFPQYFLDYQEDRVMVGVTRWKDRIVSSSGDWSGNLFDFTFKVLPKLEADLKVPFVLKGMLRVDDTPMHKLLREAVVNTLTNADYWGRRGVVISKNKDGFTFANPGGMRISKTEAIEGGVSDPRNSTILKIFSLIRFGERAGSGLNGIMHVWNKVYHTEANISEQSGDVTRTVLNLPFNGHEQDVDAMLELYDEDESIDVVSDNSDLSGKETAENTDKNGLSVKEAAKNTDKDDLSGKEVDENTDKDDLSVKETAKNTDKGGLSVKETAENTDKNGLSVKEAAKNTDKDDLSVKETAKNTDKGGLSVKETAENTDKNGLSVKEAAKNTDKDDLSGKEVDENTDKDDLSVKETAKNTDKGGLSVKETAKNTDKDGLSGIITDKLRLLGKENYKLPITDAFIDKITGVYIYISQHPHSSTYDIATFIGCGKESAKKYLQALVAIDMLTPEGAKRNRTYSIIQ